MIVHANIHMNYFGLNYPVQPFFYCCHGPKGRE